MQSEHRRAVFYLPISILLSVIAMLVLTGIVGAQDKPKNESQSQAAPAPTQKPDAATKTQTPGSTAPEQQTPPADPLKSLRELDDRVPLVTDTDLVQLTVTVTDTYGRYVSGLNKNAFTVFDDKQPQEITHFSDDDAPVSVGVLFDVSGSMSGDKIRRAREALSRFIQTSH